MKKSIFEQMGGTYHQEGDYLLPNLIPPESAPVGIWGQRHLRYLKRCHQAVYATMLLSGRLNSYLSELDRQLYFFSLWRRWQNRRASLNSSKRRTKWSGSNG